MKERKQPARARAQRWLLQALACGPQSVDAIRFQAHKAGIAWRTLQRARQGIVTAQKVGFGRGHWTWTKNATPSAEGRQEGAICPVCGAVGDRRP